MSDWVTVTVKNNGAFVLNYTVEALADGQQLHFDPGNYGSGGTKSTQLPADSTDIKLVIKDERAVNEWHTMHSQSWADASGWTDGAITFEAHGSTFHEHCTQIN